MELVRQIPAVEDQATDRAYRIGQKRDVTVYLPLLIHPGRGPDFTTFDRGLDKLISQKRALAGSLGLTAASQVSNDDLFGAVFGQEDSSQKAKASPLTAAEARKFSWEHFEALIAEIYGREAEEVFLTPRGRDHGADVVVRGFRGQDILVQCKSTQSTDLDSELAVREVEGAKLHYEKRMGILFGGRCVHTNATRFSKRMKTAAKVYSVELHGLSWLEQLLQKHQIYLAEVLERNRRRSRI